MLVLTLLLRYVHALLRLVVVDVLLCLLFDIYLSLPSIISPLFLILPRRLLELVAADAQRVPKGQGKSGAQ